MLVYDFRRQTTNDMSVSPSVLAILFIVMFCYFN